MDFNRPEVQLRPHVDKTVPCRTKPNSEEESCQKIHVEFHCHPSIRIYNPLLNHGDKIFVSATVLLRKLSGTSETKNVVENTTSLLCVHFVPLLQTKKKMYLQKINPRLSKVSFASPRMLKFKV
jgi:hypothetical protein